MADGIALRGSLMLNPLSQLCRNGPSVSTLTNRPTSKRNNWIWYFFWLDDSDLFSDIVPVLLVDAKVKIFFGSQEVLLSCCKSWMSVLAF